MGTFNQILWGTGLFGGPGGTIPGGTPASDLFYHAYREAGILAMPGRGYSPEEQTDALWCGNAIIDQWRSERLMVSAIKRSEFPITSNQKNYSIGTFGTPDWNIERPERIEAAGYIFLNATPYLEVPFRILTTQEWEAVSPKDLTSTIPYMLYYEPFVPNGNVILYPVPTVDSLVAIYTWVNIQEFVGSSDTYIWPPAYRAAFVSNLAVQLYRRNSARSTIGASGLQLLVQQAKSDLAKVKSINTPYLLQQTEAACRARNDRGGHYNILTNRYT